MPEGLFTYWDYKQLRFPRNEGMRIDFILGSAAFAAAVTDASIHRNERKGTAPSDHVPVLVDLALVAGRRRPADDLRLSPAVPLADREPPAPTGSRKGAPFRLGGYPRKRDHVPQQRAPATPSPVPRSVSRYRLDGLIGRGGMASACTAAPTLALGRAVAVKVFAEAAEGIDDVARRRSEMALLASV